MSSQVQQQQIDFYKSKSVKFWRSAVELDENEAENAEVTGVIPHWLKGTFLRVGPGKFDLDENFSMNHWWDGYSIISRFVIQDGGVKFSKKYLDSNSYKRAMLAQRPVVCEYATKASDVKEQGKSIFSKMIPNIIPELTDNSNLNLFSIDEEVYVTSETSYFHQYNHKLMKSNERLDTNKIFGVNTASAHPVTDPATGITYQIGNSLLTGLKYNLIKIPAKSQNSKDAFKKCKILTSIPSRWSTCMSYNHSFGMSQKYIILCEQPFLINVSKILGSVITREKQSFADWLEWHKEYQNRFYIIDKETGKIVQSRIEFITKKPFFYLHFINAYEVNGQLIVDLLGFDEPSMLDLTSLSKLRGSCILRNDPEESRSYHMRFVIPLKETDLVDMEEGVNLVRVKSDATACRKGKNQVVLTPEILTKRGLEMPGINKNHLGTKYRYFYASGLTSGGPYQSAICKIDLDHKEHLIWRDHENFVLGEPIFVQNPAKFIEQDDNKNSETRVNPRYGEEDDGILIVPCTDERENAKDFIVFLNASNLMEIGKASFSHVIPPSIHGLFLQNIV